MQRRNGALARPDFVLLPIEWADGLVSTWTDPDIVAANIVIDHVATVAEVKLVLRCSAPGGGRRRKSFSVSAISHPANKGIVQEIREAAPRPAWEVSAHVHVASITAYLQSRFAEAFPQEHQRPLRPYMSQDAWDMQKQVAWLRRKCVAVRTMLRRQTLAAVLQAWRGTGAAGAASSSAWLRDYQVADALYGFRLGLLAKVLRSRCKRDRAVYIAGLADAVQANQASSFQAVNRLLCRKRKKPFAPSVLPAVKEKDGTVCSSPEAVQRRWREHFSALEDGVVSSPDSLLAGALSGRLGSWPAPPSIRDVPTPLDLQQALLAAKPGKACGPDAIPGELGALFSLETQHIIFPLLLKLGLLGEEGLGHKSGSLTWLWKGKGPKSDCGSYRGILLLSSLCKAIHRAYRPCIQRHFTATASPLQLGGRKGCSVVFGSHAMRTYMRWKSALGQTSAVVFADVSAAYYSTVRSLASKPPRDAQTVSLHGASDPLSLDFQLELPCAMEQTEASPWLRAITSTLNDGTFMCLQGDDVPVATRRGTRPGSAWADLTFGVVMARILRLRDQCKCGVQGASTPPVVPWDGQRHWGPLLPCNCSACLSDLIWADDLSSCLQIDHAAEAARAVVVETAALTDSFESHAFQLSFGPGKTAALISPKGPGAKAACRCLFGGRSALCILREHSGAVSLPLISTYKHLGVLQTREGKIRCEIRARCAAAWASFRDGRTRVFRCRRLSVTRRGALLRVLVLSKLTFGAGAWPPLSTGDKKAFSGAVFSLYRATLGLRHDADQHVTVEVACALQGLPDYATLLRLEQLRYLKLLCCEAPDALWALLRQDDQYLELLREALDWLFARVQATCSLQHPREHVEDWVAVMRTRPNVYKGMVKSRGLGAVSTCLLGCTAVFAPVAGSAQPRGGPARCARRRSLRRGLLNLPQGL